MKGNPFSENDPIRYFSIILLLISFVSVAQAQQRYNYGMLLEPVDGILHGAGQDASGFDGYWDVMQEGEKPIAYMFYIDLRTISETWAQNLKSDLLRYKENMIVLQIGLELTTGGFPYTDAVNFGVLDNEIDIFIEGLRQIGLPAYVRIGYEFNGVSWNGYEPASYKTAFRKIATRIKEQDLEIATVWNYAADGVDNFMDYYPGDDVVDWWSPNVFSTNHLNNTTVNAYIDSADVHQRPLLIGESTPRFVGTTGGQVSWDQWFVPYFNLVRSNPGIKMFSYINWNWADFPQWSNWGDARLSSNALVLANYQAEMDSSIYVHSASEQDFRALLAYSDSTAPQPLTTIVVADSVFPATISWEAAVDSSKIARYLIYDEGELVDYTADTTYSFMEAGTEDVKSISITVVDRAGNKSSMSDPVTVSIPGAPKDPNEKLSNGDFELGSAFWDFALIDQNASGAFDIDTTGSMEGDNSALISVANSTGTNFHIQLRQPLDVVGGKGYIIKYQARASTNTSIEAWLQQDHDPFTGFSSQIANLTTETQSFADTARVSEDDTAYMTFFVGNSGENQIWIDSVSVVEADVPPAPDQKLVNGDFESGETGWELINFVGSAFGALSIDTTAAIGGSNSARVDVSATTGTNWHIQLRQPLTVKAGKLYAIEYSAKADQQTTMETWLQQDHSPFLGYAQETVSLNGDIQTFRDTAVVDTDDTVFMTFMVGNSGLATFWIDDVSITILDSGVSIEQQLEPQFELEVDSPFPNPTSSRSTLQYRLPIPARVTVQIYNMVGQLVQTLVDLDQPAGSHAVTLDADGMAAGVYIARIVAGNETKIKPLVVHQ